MLWDISQGLFPATFYSYIQQLCLNKEWHFYLMHRYQLLCEVAGQVTRHKLSKREHFGKENYLKRPVYPIKLVSTFQSLRLFRDPPSKGGTWWRSSHDGSLRTHINMK